METLGRLSTAVYCGTIRGEKKVCLGFQLSNIDVTPQDPSLPVYKQFAKTPFGGLISVGSELLNSICRELQCGGTIEGIVNSVGKLVYIDYTTGEHKGKTMFIVNSIKRAEVMPDVSRGVDPKKFILSPETTLEEINLFMKDCFDAKHIKESDEYQRLLIKERESENVIF